MILEIDNGLEKKIEKKVNDKQAILFRHRSMSQGNHVRYACAPSRSVAC